MTTKDFFTIIYNKICNNKSIPISTNLNDKINEFIENNENIEYENYEYECSYKVEFYGHSGVSIDIDRIIVKDNKE